MVTLSVNLLQMSILFGGKFFSKVDRVLSFAPVSDKFALHAESATFPFLLLAVPIHQHGMR